MTETQRDRNAIEKSEKLIRRQRGKVETKLMLSKNNPFLVHRGCCKLGVDARAKMTL